MERALLLLALAAGGGPLAAQGDTLAFGGVLANGYRFAYLERGAGRPLLLVHGALTDLRFWRPQLEALADSFRVLAPSRRYHYPNPWRADDPPVGYATAAADLAALIRALRLEHPVVVGHSGATLIVLELARRHPGLLGGLALVNPLADSLISDPALRRRTADARRAAWAAALEVFDPHAPAPALERLVGDWFGPGTTLAGLPAETRDRLLGNGQTLPSAAAPEPAFDCPALRAIHLPVLLLGSSDAPAAEQATLATLGDCLPLSTRLVIDGGGRTLPRSRAGATNAALRDFMHHAAP